MEQLIRDTLNAATPRPWKWDMKRRDEKEDWNIFVQGMSHWKNEGMPRSGISILDVSPNKHGMHVITAGNEADIEIIENSPVWLEWCVNRIEELKKEVIRYKTGSWIPLTHENLQKVSRRNDDES